MSDQDSLDYAIRLAERVLSEPSQCSCGLGTLARAVLKMAGREAPPKPPSECKHVWDGHMGRCHKCGDKR